MGCANSMPLMNGMEAAKTAVSDTMHAGEEALQGKYMPLMLLIDFVVVYQLQLQNKEKI